MSRSRIVALSMDEVRPLIHPAFKDKSREIITGNHNSSPGRPLWRFLYDKPTIEALDLAAWPHDWLYSYGRLPGSGTDHLTRKDADRLFKTEIIKTAVRLNAKYRLARRAARLEYRGLRIGGWRSWRKNARMMKRNGDLTYSDYEARKLAEAAADANIGGV